MPENKETPVTNIQKRTTASARARISTKRMKKSVPNSDHSYIQEQPDTNVSTVKQHQSAPTSVNTHKKAILTLLQRLDESNKALTTRMDRMEQRSFNSTPVVPQSHSHDLQHATTIPPHNALEGAPNVPDYPAVRGSDLITQNQAASMNGVPVFGAAADQAAA